MSIYVNTKMNYLNEIKEIKLILNGIRMVEHKH